MLNSPFSVGEWTPYNHMTQCCANVYDDFPALSHHRIDVSFLMYCSAKPKGSICLLFGFAQKWLFNCFKSGRACARIWPNIKYHASFIFPDRLLHIVLRALAYPDARSLIKLKNKNKIGLARHHPPTPYLLNMYKTKQKIHTKKRVAARFLVLDPPTHFRVFFSDF